MWFVIIIAVVIVVYLFSKADFSPPHVISYTHYETNPDNPASVPMPTHQSISIQRKTIIYKGLVNYRLTILENHPELDKLMMTFKCKDEFNQPVMVSIYTAAGIAYIIRQGSFFMFTKD